MIDAFDKAAQGASVQNGGLFTPTTAACWTWVPSTTFLKGLYTYKNIMRVYPLELFRNESLSKYFKFWYYWNRVNRWEACRAKFAINQLSTTELQRMIQDTGCDFVHTKGPVFYCEHSKSKSDAEFATWLSREAKYLTLSNQTVRHDVEVAVQNSCWKPFNDLIKERFRAVVTNPIYTVDWYNYCVKVIGLIATNPKFQQTYNTQLTGVVRDSHGKVTAIETTTNGVKQRVECD
jgi:hypothetical protein